MFSPKSMFVFKVTSWYGYIITKNGYVFVRYNSVWVHFDLYPLKSNIQ